MIKSPKKLASFSDLLNRENKLTVLRAIESLRNEEPFEGAIGLMASLYDRTDDVSVKKTIELFLNDLKDPSSRPEIISEIEKPYKESTISMLVSSCWQSGQDYSDYSGAFLNIFISANYAAAIECFTVLSESAWKLSRSQKDIMIKALKENPASTEKSSLASELISVLKQ